MGNKITTCFKPKRPQPKRSSHTLYTISEKEDFSRPPKKSHKIKPFFSSSIKWRCTNPRDFTYINKLRPKLLSCINFVNHRAENTGTKAIRNLCRVLTDAKRSVNLVIEDSELSFRQSRFLINSTNHLKKVEIFALPSNKQSNRQLFESLCRIGRNKNLSELTAFSTQLQFKNPRIASRLRKQFKSLREMQYLSFELCNGWNKLFQNLHPIRLLRSIGLMLRGSFDFHYYSKLSQCNQLEYMRLLFTENKKMDSKDIEYWNSVFQKTPILKNLHLIKLFDSCQDLENFNIFSECFKSLKQLITLRLQLKALSGRFIEDQQNTFFLCLFTHFKDLVQLQKLEFTIVGNFLLKNIHIEHLALFLQDLKNLKTLELNLSHLESPSEAMISLAKALRYLSALQHLRISFENNKTVSIRYKALEIFSNNIARLQLKSLDFPLFDDALLEPNNQTKDSLAPLFRVLSGFQDLANLSLDLSASKISSCEFKVFTLALKNLHKLSSVSLGLPQLDSAHNFQDLTTFFSYLEMMPNLISLHLTFTGEKFCDQEMEIIAQKLNGCWNLNRLDLFFKELSESSLNSLQTGFVNLTKLEYLRLKIGNELDFDFHNVCRFLTGLTFLKRLKELRFEGREIHSPVYTHYPMLENLEELYNLRHLTKIVVNGYRYI